MKAVLLAFSLLAGTTLFAQTTPTPATATSTVKTVTPKESISTLKLQLNRSQYSATSSAFQNKIQSDYFNNVKPVLEGLDAEEGSLEAQIKKENSWDDSYTYNKQTNTWVETLKSEVKPESKK